VNGNVHQGFEWKRQNLPVERSSVNKLYDFYDRNFTYLRLSLTEKCNFKCSYCLPDGYKSTGCESELNLFEIGNLLRGFRELGITKVRLTGGEPTLRRDIVDIVSLAKGLNFQKIALTTNGYRLNDLAAPLFAAGLTNLNVSVDSLDEINFQKITGQNALNKVLSGIKKSLSIGIPTVKINTVLLKDLNDFELKDFLEFVEQNPVSVRFIELMQTGENRDYFKKHHLSSLHINSFLKERGWYENSRKTTDGPAIELSHPDYLGKIGTIAPYSKDFCKSCNRLRVSGKGKLQLCLFGDGQINLRDFLQSPNQKDELKKKIVQSLSFKPIGHDLLNGLSGNTKNLSMIGG